MARRGDGNCWIRTLATGLASIAPAAALAQQADQADPASVATVAPESEKLEPIIVTARRREELLQKTPVSVIALSSDDLADRSVTNLRDFQNFVPNLTLAASQNVGEAAGNAFIRGIGQEDFIAGAEPGVGFYVDGVYQASPRGALMNLNDIARIEVLRGPQGTLFGRNTIGGAINIVTVRPKPVQEGRLDIIAGSYDRIELSGTVNEPLSGTLFARIWLSAVGRDGYLRRLHPPEPLDQRFHVNNDREGEERSGAGRLQLRWLVSNRLTADFSLSKTRSRNTQGATKVDEIDPNANIFPLLNALIRAGKLPGPEISNELVPDDFFATYAGGRNFSKLDSLGISTTLNGEFGFGNAELILAWRKLRTWIGTDFDGLYFDIRGSNFHDRQNQYSAELKVTGSRGPLSYTAGLFGLIDRSESLPTRSPVDNLVLLECACSLPPSLLPKPRTIRRRVNGDSYALFGQATYQLEDRLSATVGARYSYETKSVRVDAILSDPVSLKPTGIIEATGLNDDEWQSLTWRGDLAFQATPDLMFYGAIAKGYKSGGFNVRPTFSLPNLGLTAFAPETAILYELGMRSEWFDHRLRFNLTLFHTSYKDIQLRRLTVIDGIGATLIENAARARIRGAEIELVARPAKGLTLSAAYGHLAPKYLDPEGVPVITTESRFQRTVNHSFSGAGQYQFSVPGGMIELNADVSYRSKEQFQLEARRYDQDGYALIGARAQFRAAKDRWSLAIFATNLADKHYRTAGRGIASRDGFSFSSVGMPRRFGVELTTAY